MKTLNEIFLAHPRAAGEGYFAHMAFGLRFSARLFRASCAAFIHGIVPEACETTASTAVLDLADELRIRRAILAQGKATAATGSAFAKPAI